MKHFFACLFFTILLLHASYSLAQNKHEVGIKGTSFTLNGQDFDFTGVSFFNAIYNPIFNSTSAQREKWLVKFKQYGINVIRIWGTMG